jgi:hypothetical protein
MAGYPIQPGERFGQLTAQHMEHVMSRSGRVRAHWLCTCDCGGNILVDSGNLRSGNTKRCKECTNKAKGASKTTHGYTRGGAAPVYTVWQSMWSRCTIPSNRSYADYGGRGITVDPAWKSFEKFLEDMGDPGEGMQIERKDNDKGYSKENCVWATRKQQGRNKRNNIVLEYRGKTQTMIEWCEELGLKYDTVKRRLYQGWSTEEALQGGDLRRAEPSRTTVA